MKQTDEEDIGTKFLRATGMFSDDEIAMFDKEVKKRWRTIEKAILTGTDNSDVEPIGIFNENISSKQFLINAPARHGKSIKQALHFYEALTKLPKNKLVGIAKVGYCSFLLTMEKVVTKTRIIKEIDNLQVSVEYAVEEHNYKAVNYYNAQIEALRKLIKE